MGVNLSLTCKSHPAHALNVVYDASYVNELQEIVEKYGAEDAIIRGWDVWLQIASLIDFYKKGGLYKDGRRKEVNKSNDFW